MISGEAQVEHAGVRCRLPLWLVVEEESQHVHQAQQAASDASGAADPQEIVQDINAQRAQGLVRGRRRGRGGQAQAVFELLGRQGREPRAGASRARCLTMRSAAAPLAPRSCLLMRTAALSLTQPSCGRASPWTMSCQSALGHRTVSDRHSLLLLTVWVGRHGAGSGEHSWSQMIMAPTLATPLLPLRQCAHPSGGRHQRADVARCLAAPHV